VAGEGETGAGGGAAGDLYLRVRLQPHPVFERRGRDLYTKTVVPLTVAVLGGEVNVPALGGRSLRLKIPPTTQNGQVFRLRGQGMARSSKTDDKSDLYVTVSAQLPRTLSTEQRALFEQLSKLEGQAPSAA
jgi:curved DNA-binding protein